MFNLSLPLIPLPAETFPGVQELNSLVSFSAGLFLTLFGIISLCMFYEIRNSERGIKDIFNAFVITLAGILYFIFGLWMLLPILLVLIGMVCIAMYRFLVCGYYLIRYGYCLVKNHYRGCNHV